MLLNYKTAYLNSDYTSMNLHFHKYHGAGNDFIMIDNRDDSRQIWTALDTDTIASLCQRNHGIGADGLIVAVRDSQDANYRMGYFNEIGRASCRERV